jgi:hypothetical protein
MRCDHLPLVFVGKDFRSATGCRYMFSLAAPTVQHTKDVNFRKIDSLLSE